MQDSSMALVAYTSPPFKICHCATIYTNTCFAQNFQLAVGVTTVLTRLNALKLFGKRLVVWNKDIQILVISALKKKCIWIIITCGKNAKYSNLHYTRGITPKRVTSGGVHLRGLTPGQHSSEETSQRGTLSDLPAWESDPRPFAPIAVSLATTPTGLSR